MKSESNIKTHGMNSYKKGKEPSVIEASLDGVTYPIVIGSGLGGIAERISSITESKRVFILCDSFFKEGYCLQLETDLKKNGFEVIAFFMEGGRANKTIYTALNILDNLESNEVTRDSTLIAVGGGNIGDVGGFAAATFLRGMNLLNIPTTVTAQVDSAIGGKVAVNHNKTINAIGTYYHPRAVLIDIEFLLNLPERDFRSGMGEVVKSAIIKDAGFCEYLLDNSESIIGRDPDQLVEMVRRTVQIKLDHVQEDVREKGIRLNLNYGHTIGQSIEMATGTSNEIYRHGEAVCLGMMAAAHLADDYYDDGWDRVGFHRQILEKFHLPTSIDMGQICVDPSTLEGMIYENLKKDKKRIAIGSRFVLIPQLGRAEIITGVKSDLIHAAIKSLGSCDLPPEN
jgi:3-dehydroquinate synthase